MEKAYWMKNGAQMCGKPEDYFSFLDEKGHVISLVGGGGKTTLLFYLAGCFASRGMKTVVMTTTKIGCPQHWCAAMEECRQAWENGRYAVCGEQKIPGKLSSPGEEFLKKLLNEADAVVNEADGAHRLPCKAPAEHEPVILPQSDIVVAVMGLDALGRRVGEICHRSEKVQELLGCPADHVLEAKDMAAILLSPDGSRKNVGERNFFAVLNKCDDAQRLEGGRQILACMKALGHEQAVLTCGMRRSEAYEGGGKQQKENL